MLPYFPFWLTDFHIKNFMNQHTYCNTQERLLILKKNNCLRITCLRIVFQKLVIMIISIHCTVRCIFFHKYMGICITTFITCIFNRLI